MTARFLLDSAQTPVFPWNDLNSIDNVLCIKITPFRQFLQNIILELFILFMSTHKCSCSTCSKQLQTLKPRFQQLVVDYRSLSVRHQTALNTQAAYEHRSEQLARQNVKQLASIKQLQCQLEELKSQQSNQQDASLFESEKYRRDVSRNQDLNKIIDSKNKDIIFLKEQLKPISQLWTQNKQLRERIDRLTISIEECNRRIVEIQRQRNTYFNRCSSLEQQVITMRKNRVAVPTFTKDSHPKVNQSLYTPKSNYDTGLRTTSSILDQLKCGSQYSSTQEASPKASFNPALITNTYEDYLHQSKRFRDKSLSLPREGQGQINNSKDLFMIQSRIEQLQKENNNLRGQLNSKIY